MEQSHARRIPELCAACPQGRRRGVGKECIAPWLSGGTYGERVHQSPRGVFPACEFAGQPVNGHGFHKYHVSRLRHTRGAYCRKQSFLKGFLHCRLSEHMAPLRSSSASRRLQLIWRSFRLIEGKVGLAFAPLTSPSAPSDAGQFRLIRHDLGSPPGSGNATGSRCWQPRAQSLWSRFATACPQSPDLLESSSINGSADGQKAPDLRATVA
jgi:hypothetical protein